MPAITLYTSPLCGYCHRAKMLLDAKGAAYTQIDIAQTPGAREEMQARTNGARTVPQIFIGDTHVGGCDDLYALDRAGRLDALLAG